MPTGYTANIQKGISFKEYALSCARAFGALVVMRDESSDCEIPENFEPSCYHLNSSALLEIELAETEALTSDEAEVAALDFFNKKEEYRLKKIEEAALVEKSYKEMLSKVNNWNSPSRDHDKLKEFMASQINESIKFDCGSTYYNTPTKKMTGEQWRSMRLESLHKDIAYHVNGYSEEVERTNNRNEWIATLRSSL